MGEVGETKGEGAEEATKRNFQLFRILRVGEIQETKERQGPGFRVGSEVVMN